MVLGSALRPFAQTTAVALIAMQGSPPELNQRGLAVLGRLWPSEPGGLTLAQTALALRLLDSPDDEVLAALASRWDASGFNGDVVAMGWALLAAGPAGDTLRATS